MLLDRTAYCAKKSKIAIHSIDSLKFLYSFLVLAQHLSRKKIDKKYFSVKFKLQKDDKIAKKVFHRRYYVLHRGDTMSIYTYRINDPILPYLNRLDY